MSIPPKPIHPEIMYAERSSDTDPEKNIIYFTINVPDIQGEPNLDITPNQISFSATSGNPSKGLPEKEWAMDLDLWGEIVPEKTKKNATSRSIVLVLQKKELRKDYWPRLTKEKSDRNWIKCDFSKWVDEDEQEGEDIDTGDMGDMGGMGGGMPGGMGGMDMSQLMAGMGGGAGGMPGMPGMGGMGGMPGMGGMGGMPGGMDFAKMMEQMGGAGGMPDFGEDGEDGEDAGEGEEVKVKATEIDDVE